MNYRTCYGCEIDPSNCARRDEVARGIKGLGLTSVTHKCEIRNPKFSVGQRVRFTTRIGGDWEGEEHCFSATVITESRPGRYKVRVDDGPSFEDDECLAPDCFENKSGYLSISHLNIRPVNEPSRRVCYTCEALIDFEDTCWKSPYLAGPNVCARESE